MGRASDQFSPAYEPVEGAAQVPPRRGIGKSLVVLAALLFSLATYWSILTTFVLPGLNTGNSEPDFSHLASHCADVRPIQAESYLARQQALVETLYNIGASAYIAEPGASATYFANLSGSSWHLSERPLLLIVTPQADGAGGVRAQVSILTPTFEATRAKLLHIPSSEGILYPEWPEDENPYAAALSVIPPGPAPIYVDGAARSFIVDGLQQVTRAKVRVAPVEIRRLRERKSAEELEIMKCVNEVTLLSLREARKHMMIGMRESEASALVYQALTAAGLRNAGVLALFGENAALPHGSGTDRVLGQEDLILVDCGGYLLGYESDVTRTFALQQTTVPSFSRFLWSRVQASQAVAFETATNGTITAKVDRTARAAMAQYKQYFTHRLGHGIGLEGHESPYLTGGTNDIILTGHTFSNEPGIYIEGSIGIRLEDCFYIADDGKPVYLTAGVGGPAKSLWDL